jgi:predicted RNA-binding Zn-ribbon protein involved in translation (DUF1610 family)
VTPPAGRPQLKMALIPKPPEGTRAVMVQSGEGTVFIRGSGKTDWVCGECGAILLERCGPHQVQGMVFLCNACGAYNDIPV